MADLRNLTFAINIQGDESKVVKTDKAMDHLVKTTGKSTKELASTSKGIADLGSNKNVHAVGKSKRSIEDYTKSLNATQDKLKNVSGSMKKVGGNLTKFVTMPLAGIGIASAKLSQDLNKDMATIATMIPGQTERLYELRGAIQDVSIEVAKDTSEIAEATYGVISAYGDSADTMDKVALNAKAATAGVASTADALNLSSAVMKGYGDTSAKANEKVLDLAFGTLKLGQTDFSSLASSIGQVVPLATELAISQEELFGVYAAATGVTGNASEVSTQYRGVLQSLMAPTKEMSVLMSKMGYTNGKTMVESEGLGGAIQAIVDSSKESGKPLKDFIGSIQGQTLALALAGTLSEDYADKSEQLMNSSGMMTEAFDEQTNGINASGFSYAQSMQRMKVAGQNLGEAASPMISGLADGFSAISEKLASASPKTLEFVAKAGLALLALGPIIKVGGMIISGIGTVIGVISTVAGAIGVVTTGAAAATPAIGTLATVFTVLSGPVGWVIAGIVALTAAGVALYKNWDKVSEWGAKTGASIKESWQGARDATVEAWNSMTDGISNATGKIKEIWEGLRTFFKNPIKGTVNIAQKGAQAVRNKFSGKVDGSHATGLDFVNKDNYLANLHKGEMVLTEKTSNLFRSLGGTKDRVPTTSSSETVNNNYDNRVEPARKPRQQILYSPVYNIEISGTATESDKRDFEKVAKKVSREMFDEFFKEMNMKLA